MCLLESPSFVETVRHCSNQTILLRTIDVAQVLTRLRLESGQLPLKFLVRGDKWTTHNPPFSTCNGRAPMVELGQLALAQGDVVQQPQAATEPLMR